VTRIFERKPVLIGILMAAVFLVVDAAVPLYVGVETLILSFAACFLLICSALIETPRNGLICGLTALVAQNLGTFAKYVVGAGVEVAAAVVSYSILLTLTYPVTGMIGGYLGGRLTAPNRQRDAEKRGTETSSA
jgi:hypothetical protein